MDVSARLKSVPASPIRKLAPLAQMAKSQGVNIIHLNIGDPDILTPEVMLEVVRNWQINPIPYELSGGNQKLIDSWISYYHRLGYSFLDSNDIQITTGGSEAISMALFATCNPGDEVLVFEPFYANYRNFAEINSVKLVAVPTDIKDGFHLPKVSSIEPYLSGKTKAILICNPNNPTGTVYRNDEIEMLMKLAIKHHFYILSDEVYREFVYDGIKHISLLSYMERNPESVILLDSLSKRYSLCGVRIGSLVSKNTDVMSGVLRIAQGRLSSGFIDQQISARMNLVPPEYIQETISEYSGRRDVLYEGLRQISGLTITKPEGAFYLIVGLPVDDAEDFCKYLLTDYRLDNETVMLAPAAGFYQTPGKGRNEVRIAYVLNSDKLRSSIRILKSALTEYSRR